MGEMDEDILKIFRRCVSPGFWRPGDNFYKGYRMLRFYSDTFFSKSTEQAKVARIISII